MALLFQVPGYALYNHFSHSRPLDTTLYHVEGQVLPGIRIPFITITYFMFLWTCIRLSYVLRAFVILTLIATVLSSVCIAANNNRYECRFSSDGILSTSNNMSITNRFILTISPLPSYMLLLLYGFLILLADLTLCYLLLMLTLETSFCIIHQSTWSF